MATGEHHALNVIASRRRFNRLRPDAAFGRSEPDRRSHAFDFPAGLSMMPPVNKTSVHRLFFRGRPKTGR
jgi:hypothetical protein